jgi:hypothetical protein
LDEVEGRTVKITLFNGPPRSGKDTAALKLVKYLESGFERFSMPLKASFAAISSSHIDKFGNVDPYEKTKEEIIPWLGVSYRQYQIDMSEKFFKPLYGEFIFGKLLAERLSSMRMYDRIVIPDSGFAHEVKPLIDKFGEENIKLVRVHRPGFDFTGDSRSYISGVVPDEIDIQNDGTQAEFENKVKRLFA